MKYLKSYKLFENHKWVDYEKNWQKPKALPTYDKVTELDYSNQDLTELPPLPSTLEILGCYNNLQQLPPFT